jgi:hypothetical protein
MRNLRLVLAPLVCGGVLLLTTATVGRGDDECQKRTIKSDHNLHEAIKKYGPDSPEAEKWRHELMEARSFCWEHDKRWWDEDSHRWHSDREWDEHDHDH